MKEFTGAIDCFETFFADAWLSLADDYEVKLAVSTPRFGRCTFSRRDSSRGVLICSRAESVYFGLLESPLPRGVFCSSAGSGYDFLL